MDDDAPITYEPDKGLGEDGLPPGWPACREYLNLVDGQLVCSKPLDNRPQVRHLELGNAT